MIFSGTANRPLAEEVVAHLGMKLSDCDISQFADSEQYVRFDESVRGCDAFVIQSHCDPVDFHVMQQLLMIDALKRASAKRITAVSPFYPYARQDKKTRSREPIASKLIADFYEAAGANRVLSVDLHTGQIQGFFDIPLDHLTALPMLADHFAEMLNEDVVIVSPDTGRVRLAEKWVQHLSEFHEMNSSVAFLHKKRMADVRNVSVTLAVVGDVEGKTCVLVDDMIDTAGTICGAAEALMDKGATRVLACATHPVLSGPACERLAKAPIEAVVVTNTMPIPPDCMLDKIEIVSVAPIVASTMKAIFEDESVSELFDDQNQ
jgi:ribose-phosphate pyrophosphokinase